MNFFHRLFCSDFIPSGTQLLRGLIESIMAASSPFAKAALLLPLAPASVAPSGPESLRHEVVEDQRSGPALLEAKEELEHRVEQRTADLRRVNNELIAEIENRKLAEERFRLVVECVRDYAIFVVNPFGRVVTWNVGAQRMTGYVASEIIGQRMSRFYLPENAETGRAEEALRIASTEGLFEDEAWRTRKDGSRFWAHVTITAMRNSNGELLGFSKIIRDLTELKRAQEEKQKLASVVENSSDFIGISSLQGEVAFVNAAGKELLGLIEVPKEGATIIEYIAKEDRKRFIDEVLPAVFTRSRWEGETLFRNFKTGKSIPMWQHVFFVTEKETDRALALATISRDLTERKRSDEELLAAHAAMARMARVTMMGELTASIAHEINQPLAAVVTNGDACKRWLANEPPNLEKVRQSIAEITREGARAAEVIKRIRALAKRAEPQKDTVGVNDTIYEVLELLGGELDGNHVGLRTELEADLPATIADRVQLQQVILNLILNGIDAMAAVTERPKKLLIRTKVVKEFGIVVDVCDSGKGLGAAPFENLFEPFFTTKREGMGLGLSISRSIVEAHGGRLWASANPDCGATFHFTLLPATEMALRCSRNPQSS
jgi:PAS domain S-box-containing protein